MRMFVASLLIAVSVVGAAPIRAQLLNERVEGDQRICEYIGSDQLADGQVTPRITVIPSGQPCAALPPLRDPNARIPGNAVLVGELAQGNRRECRYSQGGVDYVRVIPITLRCAQTPDLLDRVAAEDGTRR